MTKKTKKILISVIAVLSALLIGLSIFMFWYINNNEVEIIIEEQEVTFEVSEVITLDGETLFYEAAENGESVSEVKLLEQNGEEVKFELIAKPNANSSTGVEVTLTLEVNGNIVDYNENGFAEYTIQMIDSVFIMSTQFMSGPCTQVKIYGIDGKEIENLIFLNDKGMCSTGFTIKENKIVLTGTRMNVGNEIAIQSDPYESVSIFGPDSNTMRDLSNQISDDEAMEAEFTIEYLGNNGFGEIIQTKVITTFAEHIKQVQQNRQ